MASFELTFDHFEGSDFFLVSDYIGIQFVNTA